MTLFWRDDAACRLEDAKRFDEVDRVTAGTTKRVNDAIAVCQGCPVAGPCLTEARENRDSGIRGGMYLEHGDPVRVPDDRPLGMRRALSPCGTLAAARRHERDGEPRCEQCRAAHAAAERKRARYRLRERKATFAVDVPQAGIAAVQSRKRSA